jgi:hypothetical protein
MTFLNMFLTVGIHPPFEKEFFSQTFYKFKPYQLYLRFENIVQIHHVISD